MKYIFILFILLTQIASAEQKNKELEFTNPNSNKILKLEERIAYFFGTRQPELVAKHYMEAIKKFENSENKEVILPHLEAAYSEIQKQTNLNFNVKTAAAYELELIMAQANKANFDQIYDIMVNIYQVVFNTKSEKIEKAAMLRTFLYKYKIKFFLDENKLSDEEYNLMVMMADQSKNDLNSLHKK